MPRISLRHLTPNLLTVARFIAAGAFPFVPEFWRLPLIVAALASDMIDGVLSRLLHAESRFGQLADPIADKSFAAAVVLTYLVEGGVTWLEVLLVLARDVLVLLGAVCFFVRDGWVSLRCMKSRLLGKITTALQFAFFFSVWLELLGAKVLFLVASLVVGLFAAWDYFRTYQQQLAETKRGSATSPGRATQDISGSVLNEAMRARAAPPPLGRKPCAPATPTFARPSSR